MNYLDLYNLYLKYNLISPIYGLLLQFLDKEIEKNVEKEDALKIFLIYFSLVCDGNVCISLTEELAYQKIKFKLDSNRIVFLEKDDFDEKEYDLMFEESLKTVQWLKNKDFQKICNEIIGENKLFNIDENWLYARKYNVARKNIISCLDKLFKNNDYCKKFNYQKCLEINNNFKLSDEQEKAVIDGYNKNLIITGGPGTGKTTSILFLLINLLEDKDYPIYLIAPSGKAANRMKESIINGLNLISTDYKLAHPEIIRKIESLESSTIHRLLGIDYIDGGYKYNKNKRFNADSIFIIDEASMIDICLFSSLLSAINSNSRVFIMGDKNQLPSVESGAVFAELLKKDSLKNNVIELKKSKRFKEGSTIYNLAEAVNDGKALPINDDEWNDYKQFKIIEDDGTYPIHYYLDYSNNIKDRDIIDFIINIWASYFFKNLQKNCTDILENDYQALDKLFKYSEISKILCAENDGNRGVKYINKIIKKSCVDESKNTSLYGFYPGQIMMVNTNNKSLDLANGDSGVLVSFKDDPTIYFMCQKSSLLVSKEGKQKDKIFKLGAYTFYPLRLIPTGQIDLAYAISIHKSQGSDHKNILVILPKKKGHPLLNRQIIYTAITRTKGSTYILSNIDRLNEGKDNVIIRDTNIA